MGTAIRMQVRCCDDGSPRSTRFVYPVSNLICLVANIHFLLVFVPTADTPLVLRYHGSTCHHIRGNGLYLRVGDAVDIYQAVTVLLSDPSVLRVMEERAEAQRDLLSYRRVARECSDYCESLEPGTLHRTYMNSWLCQRQSQDFLKLVPTQSYS